MDTVARGVEEWVMYGGVVFLLKQSSLCFCVVGGCCWSVVVDCGGARCFFTTAVAPDTVLFFKCSTV